MDSLRLVRSSIGWVVARSKLRSERGASAVEYGLMIGLIAAAVILAVFFLGQRTSYTFSCTASAISAKVNC